MSLPRVSIVMSVYNNVSDLPKALESIRSQTLRDWELILVNDGSTDGSGELMDRAATNDSRIRVIHQANAGLGPALHNGCKTATAELIARQDADDWSEPKRLELQVEHMSKRSDVVLCGTWAWFDHPSYGRQYSLRMPDDDSTLRGLLTRGVNPFVHGSCIYRTAAYRQSGGYRFRRFEDIDLWLRLSQLGKFGIVESEQYNYLISPGGISINYSHHAAALGALSLSLHRERTSAGCESTDWRDAHDRILAEKPPALPSAERDTVDYYLQGIRSLKRRRYEECLEFLSKAARGVGPCAASARRFSWIAGMPGFVQSLCLSMLRRAAQWRNGHQLEPFIHYVP